MLYKKVKNSKLARACLREFLAQALARVACASCLRKSPCARSLAQAFKHTHTHTDTYPHANRMTYMRLADVEAHRNIDLRTICLREPCASLAQAHTHIHKVKHRRTRTHAHAYVYT